ncbi:MAG TPA: hypothetical protein VEW04_10915 [Allosphingosinicella sp.]|nr:hypothetical protein [Allosphingosinicella sp.]
MGAAVAAAGRLVVFAAAAAILSAAAPAPLVDRLAGRYSHRFTNSTIFGETSLVEDVLEIVPIDRHRGYFRAELNFFNDHMCAISGVARVEGRSLVYRASDPRLLPGPGCVMRIRQIGARLDLDDGGGTCRSTCGARGSYSGGEPEFRLSSRRRINSSRRIRQTPDFRDALAEDARSR